MWLRKINLKTKNKIIKNGTMSIKPKIGTYGLFINGMTTECFHKFGKIYWDKIRLKINSRTGTDISEQPFMTKLGI